MVGSTTPKAPPVKHHTVGQTSEQYTVWGEQYIVGRGVESIQCGGVQWAVYSGESSEQYTGSIVSSIKCTNHSGKLKHCRWRELL